jgi:fatty-acyl-CoA synthase
MAGHELKIVDDDGRPQPEGRVGEIVVRGPSVSVGYYRDEVATAETFRDGWLHTGDLGLVRGGELFVTGRKSDMIILRGRNYYPQDIEWCAQDLRGVRDGGVVAFAHQSESEGDVVVVVVETDAREMLDELAGEVAKKVRGELGIVVADTVVVEKGALPKTTSGKIRRVTTRDLYLSGAFRELACLRAGRSLDGDVVRAV